MSEVNKFCVSGLSELADQATRLQENIKSGFVDSELDDLMKATFEMRCQMVRFLASTIKEGDLADIRRFQLSLEIFDDAVRDALNIDRRERFKESVGPN